MTDNFIIGKTRAVFNAIRPVEYRLLKIPDGETILQGLFQDIYEDGIIAFQEWRDIPTVEGIEED